MSTVAVTDSKGAKTGQVTLGGSVLDGSRGEQAVHEVVVAYQANQRQGNHSTLTRAEVSGGGRKPYRQKGTGRARQGSTRAIQYRHGGVAFGPKPRDYSKRLPKRVRRLAFERAFGSQWNSGRVSIVSALDISEPKTKLATEILDRLGMTQRPLLILLDETDQNVRLATRNIAGVETAEVRNANIYQVLRARQILITRAGLDAMAERLGAQVVDAGAEEAVKAGDEPGQEDAE
jgi:large subunit ribosomal protein L4